jgi:multidrug efflux pump subunit AcrA (membrane-fusion protein)
MNARIHTLIILLVSISAMCNGQDSSPESNMVILDETGVRNLRIETVMVRRQTFEKTVFAIGRVEEIPARKYSISSRIPGRAIEINAFVGDTVKKGQVLVRVESRQPGDPPPMISLTALQDGLVVASHVLTGQPVEPAQDLLDISDRSEVWVVARIPEQLAAGITKGTRARISFPAISRAPVEAELLRFGVEADIQSGTVDGIFQIPNPDGLLQPGMRAEFSIVVDSRPNVLAVPESAVQGDPVSRVVYVKDFELPNAFIKSPVVLGERGHGWVEVHSGVFPGDEVVTRGSYSLGFAGGSSMSLKEALDAAHGHEHNEDGSEITPDQRNASTAASQGGGAGPSASVTTLRFFQVLSAILTVVTLVLLQTLRNVRAENTRDVEKT